MSIYFIVAADVFVRAVIGSEDDWQHLGSRNHLMDFVTMERCEEIRDEMTDRVADFLEAQARDWWMRELDVDGNKLRIEISVECRNGTN